MLGNSPYRGRKGVEPLGGKGIYVLLEPKELPNGNLKIENNLARARLQKVLDIGSQPGIVESNLVFPMVGGRNVERWGIKEFAYILFPHENKKGPHNAISETKLKIEYTKTYKWLDYYREVLLETRKRNGKFFDENIDPFYALDNVGLYTFAPFKVIWREQKSEMVSCVISRKKSDPLKDKLIITDSKILSCSLDTEDEAHYLCSVLNSIVVRYIIENYTIDIQRGIDILKNIAIPKFNSRNKVHSTLRKLSIRAHETFGAEKQIKEIEKQIDEQVSNLFKIDLSLIYKYYN